VKKGQRNLQPRARETPPSAPNAATDLACIGPETLAPATPPAFDAIDEKFIDFLVEEALKTWRARIS
jgi:hypothetical protein